jgi:Kef-type K+ transport system membrane component KefB
MSTMNRIAHTDQGETMSFTTARPASHRGGSGILLGLIPWILFTLVADHGTLKLASVVALALAIGVCAYSARGGGSPKSLEVAAVVAFVGFVAVAFVADASLTHWLTRYARAIAAALLALVAFGSLLHTPFTEQYARQSVPREFWSSPRFKAINRRLTIMWGGIFAVMTVSHVIAGALDTRLTNVIFNWVIPIVLIVKGAQRSTGSREDADATTA